MKVPVLRAVFAALMLVLSAPDGASAQTAPAAKPAKVELEPGGKPVKITLQGKDLDAFAGAQVVLKNRPVKDIEAKLDKGSAKKRVLTLVAKPGAKAEKGYKIQLIDEKTKKPVDLKVKLVIAAANAPPAVVKIEAPKQVEAGIAFEVKISVSDDKGVALVVLTVGGKSQKIKARGRPKEVLTVKLKAEKAGKLAIEAVAVDKDKAKSEPVNAVVDVTGLNQPPVIAKIEAPKAVGIGVAFEVKISVSDDKGVALVVLTVGGKSQKIKAKGRPKEVLTVKLKAEKAGKLAIEAVAVDKDNAKSKPVKAAVDVTGLNQPPVIAKIEAPKAVGIGVAFEVKIAASDDKGVALVVLTVGGKPQKIKAKGRLKEVLTVKLKAGKAGTLAIEAVAVDNDNAKSKPVKAAVDVTGLNQPPVIAKIEAPKAVEAGAAFEIKITATDDRGLAEVVLTVGGKPQTLKAKVQPQEVLTAKLTADKAGKLQIEAVAVDGDKATSKPAIASVDVGAPNQPPVIAAIDAPEQVEAGAAFEVTVTATDDRGLAGVALTVGGTAQTLTAQGRTKETLTATLVAEKAGTLAIEAVAIDGDKAKSTPVTASVDVGASNQPPVVAAIDAPAQVEAGAAFEVTVTATDDRGLAGVVLTVGGTAQTLNAQGRTKETLTATLTAEKAGTLAIEAVAIDGDKATSTPVSASIAVGAPNQPPVIAAIDAPEQVEAGAAFEVTVTATDDRGLAGVALTVGGTTQTLTAQGRTKETLTATIVAEKAGTLAIEAVAIDGDKATSKPAIASVDVGASNQPPVIAGIDAPEQVEAGAAFEVTVTATDDRELAGVVLTVGGTAQTLNAQGRTKETLTATLVAEKAGTLAIEAVAIDGDNAESKPVTASIAVGAPNQPPVIAAIDAPAQVEAGAAFEVTVTATDDRGLAGVALTVGGTAQTLTAQGRTKETLTATLVAEKAGTLAIEAVAIDGDKATSTPVTASVDVGASNQPPVIAGIDAPEQVEAGAAFEVTVTATDDRGLAGVVLTVGGTAQTLNAQGRT